MPSATIFPARLSWTGQALTTSFDPVVITPGLLLWSGGSITAGIEAVVISTAEIPELDRLTPFDRLSNQDGTPTIRNMAIWQSAMEQIEAAFSGQQGQITDLQAIVERLEDAEAQGRAAQDKASETALAQALGGSFTDSPSNPLTASSDGTITIAAHTRVYPGAGNVSVGGGSVTGKTAGVWNIYYSDATRAGGVVAYQATQENVAQTGSTHVVGQVRVPATGEVDTTGDPVRAPGGVDPQYSYSYDQLSLRYFL